MAALKRDAREASEAERWVRENRGVMDTAKANAPDLGGWRDILASFIHQGLAGDVF